MSQIVDVGTWIALITGIIGISLSGVAIWFAFSVDSRSRRVSEQMIQSLQKIETFVERSSSDTQGLIKVGWDRMLGGVGPPADRASEEKSESSIQQISAGLAEEARVELGAQHDSSTTRGAVDEDRIVRRVSEAIQAQLRSSRPARSRPYERVEEWASALSGLPPTAYELVRFLGQHGHINRTQYNALNSHDAVTRSALHALRQTGIIIPLTSTVESKANLPVYWFPPDEVENIRIAVDLVNSNYGAQREELRELLTDVGYLGENNRVSNRGWGRRLNSRKSNAIAGSELQEQRDQPGS